MIFNAVILALSSLLLVYWFRYTCLLVLHSKPERDYSRKIAAANHLKVFEVQTRLAEVAATGAINQSLDGLEQMLDRDYRLLLYLIRHAANFKTAGYEIEQIFLVSDYRIMKAAYGFSRRFSVSRGSKQLSEMAAIITHVANRMGQRAALAGAP